MAKSTGREFPGPQNRLGVFCGQTFAVARETLLQSRGFGLWIVLVIGGAAALALGTRLPGSGSEDPAPLIFHATLALIFVVAAMASGARGLAGDRRDGIRDLFGSMPLHAAAYFLGRFLGLAARFTAAVLLIAAAGGVLLSLLQPERSFRAPVEPDRFTVAGVERGPAAAVLLPPDGSRASWRFTDVDSGAAGPQRLRFGFRVKLPGSMPLQASVPVRILASAGGETILEQDVALSLRREFTLDLPEREAAASGKGMEVHLSIRGGHNLIETGFRGCVLVRGEIHPAAALLAAAVSLVPLIWTALALGLCFSAFVSEPTALLAASAIVLIVLSGPGLQRDLQMAAAGGEPHTADCPCCAGDSSPAAKSSPSAKSPPSSKTTPPADESPTLLNRAAAAAAWLCRFLPDPHAGGGARPLGRGECPSVGDVTAPWREGLLHLAAVILIGCLATSWRRS